MREIVLLISLLCLGVRIQAQNDVITVAEAIAILDQAIFSKNEEWGTSAEVKFKNPKVVNAIIAKYGYKKIH